jgi:hypothetical protein
MEVHAQEHTACFVGVVYVGKVLTEYRYDTNKDWQRPTACNIIRVDRQIQSLKIVDDVARIFKNDFQLSQRKPKHNN